MQKKNEKRKRIQRGWVQTVWFVKRSFIPRLENRFVQSPIICSRSRYLCEELARARPGISFEFPVAMCFKHCMDGDESRFFHNHL